MRSQWHIGDLRYRHMRLVDLSVCSFHGRACIGFPFDWVCEGFPEAFLVLRFCEDLSEAWLMMRLAYPHTPATWSWIGISLAWYTRDASDPETINGPSSGRMMGTC